MESNKSSTSHLKFSVFWIDSSFTLTFAVLESGLRGSNRRADVRSMDGKFGSIGEAVKLNAEQVAEFASEVELLKSGGILSQVCEEFLAAKLDKETSELKSTDCKKLSEVFVGCFSPPKVAWPIDDKSHKPEDVVSDFIDRLARPLRLGIKSGSLPGSF